MCARWQELTCVLGAAWSSLAAQQPGHGLAYFFYLWWQVMWWQVVRMEKAQLGRGRRSWKWGCRCMYRKVSQGC